MANISNSSQPVALGAGYFIRAPGFSGTAEVLAPATTFVRSTRAASPSLLSVDAVLRASGFIATRDIEVQLQPVAAPGVALLRSVAGEPALELDVPDPGADYGQVVLSVDDSGALRWHFHEQLPVAIAPQAGTRGAGPTRRYRIPAMLPPPPLSGAQQRSLLGFVGKKVLKVLVYPISDAILGFAADQIASRWEAEKRPHRLRRFTPDDYTDAATSGIDLADVTAMHDAGRVLLFIHGTFSTSQAAFGDLPRNVIAQLHARYAGRVVAFDHPTLADDPASNVRWLLERLPAGLRVDVVCHSRGGLVSRLLAERPAAFGLDPKPVEVRRLVFVASPNAGTPLANKDYMVDMIDRLTTVFTLFPSGPAIETLEALVTVVKVLGRGLLTGLEGLAAMRPDGEFMSKLNAGGSPFDGYYAVASNYEPSDRGLRALVTGAADNLLDYIFKNAGNDLVVPTDGVHAANGYGRFPVPAERLQLLGPEDAAMHTAMFGNGVVASRLLEWLAP